jgi:hypothetical protein
MATKDDWMNRKWRPAMGWMYMTVCITDFILFPVLWSIFKAYMGEGVDPWNPLTLQGAGLFHLAMGAVLGVAAWSRGREKIAGASNFPTYPNQYQNNQYGNEYHEYEYEYESQTPTRQRRPNIRSKPVEEEYPIL